MTLPLQRKIIRAAKLTSQVEFCFLRKDCGFAHATFPHAVLDDVSNQYDLYSDLHWFIAIFTGFIAPCIVCHTVWKVPKPIHSGKIDGELSTTRLVTVTVLPPDRRSRVVMAV